MNEITVPMPEPAVLSDDGLAAVAGIIGRTADAYQAAHELEPTDASAWLSSAADSLRAALHGELRRRIDLALEESVRDLLDGPEGS